MNYPHMNCLVKMRFIFKAYLFSVVAVLLAPQAFAEATNITLRVGETSQVITRTYSNRDRWWKLADGDTKIVSAAFVEANPTEPRMSKTHTTSAMFTFTALKPGGPTTWLLYTYSDQGEARKGTYPGYDKTGTYRSWSSSCGHTFTVTVVDPSYVPNPFSVSPYLQHPTTNGMSILFFTLTDLAAQVRCWPVDDDSGNETRVVTTSPVVASALVGTGHSSDAPVWGTQYRHRVRFDGLKAGTRYEYVVEAKSSNDQTSPFAYTNFFSTVPGRDTPVRIVAYSDSETTPSTSPCTEWDVLVNGKNQTKTYHVSRSEGFASNLVHMAAWRPDLMVIAGDLVARGGVQMYWDEFWKENAGANDLGFNDPAGSIPILATLGNHDFYDNKGQTASGYYTNANGEFALAKYLTYFEFASNGVDYANAPAAERDSRDLSQLFHRQDYGPVTLIFLDTNNGKDAAGNDTNTGLTRNGSSGARSPDFNPGTLQYAWLTNNLADAQARSRFTFVVNHHCPYSSGKHIRACSGTDESQSALPVRALTDVMMRYGVDAWLCGHDEMQEHSQITGFEVRPDGTKRSHALNIYDLGSGGDGLKGDQIVTNAYSVHRAYLHSPDGTHYGHLRIEVKKGTSGRWQCSLMPVYSYMTASHSSELRAYADKIVIYESGSVGFEEFRGGKEPIEPALPELSDERPEEFAAVLAETPLQGRILSLDEYRPFKQWAERGVDSGGIADLAFAKTNPLSYFSYVTDQQKVISPAAVTGDKIQVREVQLDGASVRMTVAIDDLPVGENARQECLQRVFGATGTAALDEPFEPRKVAYRQDLQRNQDGSVSFTVEPNPTEVNLAPKTYFFKARIQP